MQLTHTVESTAKPAAAHPQGIAPKPRVGLKPQLGCEVSRDTQLTPKLARHSERCQDILDRVTT